MLFDVMKSFVSKEVVQPPHITGDHYDGKNVAGLVSAAKFKKNTISLHEVLPTHVYAKFKTDETDVFGF